MNRKWPWRPRQRWRLQKSHPLPSNGQVTALEQYRLEQETAPVQLVPPLDRRRVGPRRQMKL
eukprot:4385222-Amphidinium_carterae.1